MKNISVSIDSDGVVRNFDRSNYNPSFKSNEETTSSATSGSSSKSNGNVEEIDLMAPLEMATSVRNNYFSQIETKEEEQTDKINNWITYVETTISDIENEKSSLENTFNDFRAKAHDEAYPGLWNDGSIYYPPDEVKTNFNARDHFLIENGYPTNEADANYQKGIDAFNKYIDEEYTPLFNKYLKEYMGMTYEEYTDKINEYSQDINNLKSQLYSLRQQAKEAPYLEIKETEEYKDYCENNKFDVSRLSVDGKAAAYGNLVLYLDGKEVNVNYYGTTKDPINPIFLAAAIEEGTISYKDNAVVDDRYNLALRNILGNIRYDYLTEDDKMMYSYLFDTKGKDAADKYIEDIEDRLNQAEGQKEMEDFMALITDENGEINYNAWSGLLANGKGILSGISNFGEGLANVFATEGMISSNQYAQMYILNALTNTSTIYVNDLAEKILVSQGDEASTEFIKEMINSETGEINLDYARSVLTTEEYDKLVYKINKDKKTILDDAFQLGTSFGNMVPTLALTIALSYCGATPAAIELVGNVLMGLSAGGNAKNQALVSGNDLLSSTIYGILSGTSETCLGMLLGNIPGLNVNAALSLKGIFKEGAEEFLQEYVDAGLRCAILGETVNIDELNGDALKSFVYGCLMSFGTNAVSMGTKMIVNGKSVEINNIGDLQSFFKILNDSGVLVGDKINDSGKADGVAKTILIDEDVSNKSKMIDMMKSIYKDADIYIKSADGNISYASYAGNGGLISGMINDGTSTNIFDNVSNMDVDQDTIMTVTAEVNADLSKYKNDILKSTENIEDFNSFITLAKSISDDNVPNGFSSATQYKNFIMDTLINSGRINDLNNNYIYQLTTDPVMFSRLLETNKVDSLITKNIVSNGSLLAKSFKNLTTEQFNTLFSSESIKDCINNLSADDFGKVLKFLSKNDVSFLQSSTFIDKFKSMNTNEFYGALNMVMDFSQYNFIKEIVNSSNCSEYVSFLDYVSNNFATEEVFMNNPEYIDRINKILGPSFTKNETINSLTEKIKAEANNTKISLYKKIVDTSDVKLDLSFIGKLSCNDDIYPNNFYDVTYVLNGETKSFSIKADNNYIDLRNEIKSDMLKAVQSDDFRILSIERNNVKSNLYLTNESGLSEGINKIKLNVDGKETSILMRLYYSGSLDLNRVFPDAKTANIISVESIASQNVSVDNINSIYEVSYLQNGIEKSFLCTPEKNGELDIDGYFCSKDIVDFSNVTVMEKQISDIKTGLDYTKSKAGIDIFSSSKYGGSQDDVYSILKTNILNEAQGSIEMQMAVSLKNVIKNRFPNATDMDIINISEAYANSGCAYMAMANSIATYMGNLEDGASIFKKRFGYDLYFENDGNKCYNVETIALDMFLNYHSDMSIEQILKADSLGLNAGSGEYYSVISKFLSNKDIGVTSDYYGLSGENVKNDLVSIIGNTDSSEFKILSSRGFNLELMEGDINSSNHDGATANSTVTGKIIKDVGGHAMLITDLDADNNVIVSSWKQKYRFDTAGIQALHNRGNDTWTGIVTIRLEIK